jgi:Ca-activated chloride channel family protein
LSCSSGRRAAVHVIPAPPQLGSLQHAKGISQRSDGKIVIGTGIVNVLVSVTDPLGRFVTGLGIDHFDVFDDKVKQQISLFSDEDAPISIGVIYDVSGSMKERISRSVRALRRFIETSHTDDDFFLIAFNDRANLIQDFTTSADQIAGHLMFVRPKGSTALYDAMYLEREGRKGRHKKKALYNLRRPSNTATQKLRKSSRRTSKSMV